MTEQADKLPVIILAAGRASRFGSAKQLAELNGQTLLSIALAQARQISDHLIVVTGAYADQIQSQMQAELEASAVQVVYNPDWQLGMSSSIQVALNSLETEVEAAVILLADQPLVSSSHLTALIDVWQNAKPWQRPRAVATQYNASLGVPALFDRSAFDHLFELSGDQGARRFLNAKDKAIESVEPDFSTLDIDTPEQLSKIPP